MRRKLYTFLNVSGLALGLGVCLVIWRYCQFELSYDSFHTKAPNIYRVMTTLYSDQNEIPYVGWDLAPALKDEFGEIRQYVRVSPTYDQTNIVTVLPRSGERQNFDERNIQFADSTFFDVFTYQFINGNSSIAFLNPASVVITETTAKKYFPDGTNPLGRVIRLSGGLADVDYQITGVIRNVPQNSHFTFDLLFNSYHLIHGDFYKDRPRWDGFFTYVELMPNASLIGLEAKMGAFIKRYQTPSEYAAHKANILFQPLRSIHTSLTEPGMGETDKRSGIPVSFYLSVSLLILSIAWINYVNLSTARAVERAKEVGIKKAIGVKRGQLIQQFILESVILNFISLAIAILGAMLLFPVLSNIVGKTISFHFSDPILWTALTGLLTVGSLISGAYPALVLSSSHSASMIKGYESDQGGNFSLRKVLVIFQFAASLFLITGTLAIYLQVQFMTHYERGMSTDRMLIISGPKVKDEKDPAFDFGQRTSSFKTELLKLSIVQKVASSEVEPGGGHNWETHVSRVGANADEIIPGENMNVVFTEPDLIDTYGLELLSGRVWELNANSNMSVVMINEAAIKPFGLKNPEHALHEKLVTDLDTVEIIGVLKNFHWHSLKTGHVPMMLWPTRSAHQRFSVLLNGSTRHAVKQIESLYAKVFPGNPFTYYFLDDFFNRQYDGDRQFGEVFSLFALFALVIACLGLFGLASFTIASKLKEISIRKVLGASVKNIVVMLSGRFLKLVIVAGIFTLPVAWYAVDSWLRQFAFRIEFGWKLYIVPVIGLMVLAALTVSFQTIKASLTNPVDGLRSE